MNANEAYESFKNSACFKCMYCKEYQLLEDKADTLDVRRNGVVKIWCYAAGDVVPICIEANYEDCIEFV